MKKTVIIILAIAAALAGLLAGAALGVLVVGLVLGIAGAAIVGLIGWGVGKAAHHKLTHNKPDQTAVESR